MNTPSPRTRALRVLVADDHPINLRLAARVLRELGHGGVVVPDGEQALRALAGQRFDVVLMDVSMPVLDGISALRQLREREALGQPRTRVVMVTGHDTPEDRAHLLAQGADGYLAKPLDAARLLAELGRLGLT